MVAEDPGTSFLQSQRYSSFNTAYEAPKNRDHVRGRSYASNVILRRFDKVSAANEAYCRELRAAETDGYGSETNNGQSRPDPWEQK